MSHYVPYNLKFFDKKLREYEAIRGRASDEVVHEAQMILKEVSDLYDQGYMWSYNSFVDKLNIVERLTKFIEKNDKKAVLQPQIPEKHLNYSNEKINLLEYLNKVFEYDKTTCANTQINPLFFDILAFTKMIYESVDKDTAVVFLLRDTLLPYLAFKEWCGDKMTIKPWLIGRKWLSLFPAETGENVSMQSTNFGDNNDLYEAIYHAIYTSLDDGNDDFVAFVNGVKKYLNEDLSKFKKAKDNLKKLLGTISEKKILVVETGRIASIPLLLKCVDDRVDFRLFTTVPAFYNVYKGRYFTNEYDKNRLFETIMCQDCLFQLAEFVDGNLFMVKETTDSTVLESAKQELAQWQNLIKNNRPQ